MKYLVFYAKQMRCPMEEINIWALADTHVLVKEIDQPTLEDVFTFMQGEIWSPNGEARELIKHLGLKHTSMSVGDIVVESKPDGKAWYCNSMGWYEIDTKPPKYYSLVQEIKKNTVNNMKVCRMPKSTQCSLMETWFSDAYIVLWNGLSVCTLYNVGDYALVDADWSWVAANTPRAGAILCGILEEAMATDCGDLSLYIDFNDRNLTVDEMQERIAARGGESVMGMFLEALASCGR